MAWHESPLKTDTVSAVTGISYNTTNIDNANVNCYKYGRLVILDITTIETKTAIGENDEEMLTNLPLPISDTGRYTLFDSEYKTPGVVTSNLDRVRVKITSDGKLVMWYNQTTTKANTKLYGNIVYFTAT